ncbi:MAG: aminotransferase class I/II-fold pyridoxal phosphate-dependent enzyme [bacterium]|nr:aminotransferase class I/II-fold pyridoxal phosphate-dependent enzyme [bacterium]
MRNDFSSVVDRIPPSGIRKFFDLVVNTKGVISLGVGESDFATPWGICEEAIESLEKGYTTYTSNRGHKECCKSITDYLKDRFGCDYKPNNEIVVTVGVSEGVDIVLRALLNPGDEILLPEPTYVCYAPLINLAGGKVVPIDTTDSGFMLDVDKLEQHITKKTKALILCSPNNPTGMVIPKEQLEKVAALAEKYDFWVISDEVYAEIVYDEDYVSFSTIKGMKERTVLLSGFSKAFAMTGWRLGYVCGPESIISRALKIHQYNIMCAPITSQFAAISALRHSEKYVKKMRESYCYRRNFFVKKLNDTGLDTMMPDGAFYCFPSISNTGYSSEEFAFKLLEEQKVAVVPGPVFGSGGEGYIRCCYATNLELLKEALLRIETFLKKQA